MSRGPAFETAEALRNVIPEARGVLAEWLAERVRPDEAQWVRRRLRYGSFVSPRHGYLYVETPKAACSTIKAFLANLEGKPTPRVPRRWQSTLDMAVHNRGVHPVRNIFQVDPKTAVDFLEGRAGVRFAVTRNPYSRIYSAWSDKIFKIEPAYRDLVAEISGKSGEAPDFPAFLSYIETRGKNVDIHWRPVSDVILADVIAFDRVLSFEDLAGEMQSLSATINAGDQVKRFFERSRNNASFGAPWQAAYDAPLAEIVQNVHAADFERFRYDPDSWIAQAGGGAAISPPDPELIRSIRKRNEMIAALHRRVAELEKRRKDGSVGATDDRNDAASQGGGRGLAARRKRTGLDDDLVEQITAFRLGNWAEHEDVAAFSDVVAFVRGDKGNDTVAAYDAGLEKVLDFNGYDQRLERRGDLWSLSAMSRGSDMRVANFFSYLDSIAVKGRFTVNFSDAPRFAFNEQEGPKYPVFQFVRHQDDAWAALFPLDFQYMGWGSRNIPRNFDEIDIPFDQKIDRAVWRGRLHGSVASSDGTDYAKQLWQDLSRAKNEAEFESILLDNRHFPRIRLYLEHADDDDVDLGIVASKRLKAAVGSERIGPRFSNFLADPMSIEEQLRYRYVICVPGNDYASGLYWALLSNSAVLMPDPLWRTPFDCKLAPWEHFVPLHEDLSNLRAQLEWCRSNPAEVKEMVQRGKRYMRTMLDPALRDEVDRRVVQRVARLVNRRFKNRPLSYATDRRLSKPRLRGDEGVGSGQ